MSFYKYMNQNSHVDPPSAPFGLLLLLFFQLYLDIGKEICLLFLL